MLGTLWVIVFHIKYGNQILWKRIVVTMIFPRQNYLCRRKLWVAFGLNTLLLLAWDMNIYGENGVISSFVPPDQINYHFRWNQYRKNSLFSLSKDARSSKRIRHLYLFIEWPVLSNNRKIMLEMFVEITTAEEAATASRILWFQYV